MFKIKLFKINIINLILCLRLAALHATTISDHSTDNSNNNHDSIKYLYDNLSNNIFNTDQYNTYGNLNNILSTPRHLQEPTVKANDAVSSAGYTTNWATQEELLESPLTASDFRARIQEKKCFMDSLKLALKWWSHSNGTLKQTNSHALSPLQQLDLSYHNIAADEDILTLIPQKMRTVTLSLAYNKLKKAPFQTLQMMGETLKYLSLMGNPFKDKISNRDAEQCLLYKDDLLFSNNNARISLKKRPNFGWPTFPYMPSLLELDISDCQIEHISRRTFRNLTNLKHLYMSHNNMLNIPSDTFAYTPSLQVLDLSFANVGKQIIENIKYSPNFKEIMKYIFGITIEENMFRYLPNLQYLDLSHSKLSRSSAVAFARIGPSLKYLSLCYTYLKGFNRRIFKNSSLVGLDLSGNTNAACSLAEDFFDDLSDSLKFLFFEKANLRDLSWLKSLRNLRFLALAGNNINTLLAEYFMDLKQLQILDLSSNQVVNWYSSVFGHNKNLNILSLRENNINVLTSEMLKDFSMLKLLSMGRNNFICDCMLHDLVDVAAFNNRQDQCNGNFWQDLRNNLHINSIHLSEIVHNSNLFTNTSLRNLDISSLLAAQHLNKLQQSGKEIMKGHNFKIKAKRRFTFALRGYNVSKFCTQHSKWFLSHYIKLNSTLIKLQLLDYEDEHYWCYNETKKEQLVGLNCQRNSLAVDIEHELNKLTTYILASVFTLISIAIIGIIIYTKRWYIYYYYSSLKSAALLSVISKDKRNEFNNLCDQSPSMVYDIFVSYCQSDRDWIVEEFMPNIEESADISICLHERDFQVGVTILDNIQSCMERSKVLMLIISANFLLSHWCQFEMQLAQYHILDLSRDNLILVFLEDIPRSKRPKNLQFLMSVKTYIRWPGGKSKGNVQPEEYKLFWKRLKRSLKTIYLQSSDSTV